MTNGEKLKEIFPNGVLTSINNSYYWGDDILVSKGWWNSEYKELTTKNDLGVDCNNCKNNLHRGDGSTYCATGDGICHYECEEPKTGHWDDIPKYKDIAWQCSECGHFTTMKHNFCADCGCRMVEPQESEEQK